MCTMKWTVWFIVTFLQICVIASNRRTICPRKGACQLIHTINLQYALSDSWPHSVEILFTDHMVLYCTKGLCHPLSGVYHITGRRSKGKGLVVPCKYNYCCGPTKDQALIQDLAFIFLIMLFCRPLLHETRCLYETDHNSRDYGILI